jgi:lipopolysaccharide heptosyltransferase II
VKELIRRPLEALLKLYLGALPTSPAQPAEVRRILVFAYHGLGNFIMYTPALRLLRERYPEARIDLQVGNNTGCEEVLAGADVFDNIYNLPYSFGVRAWLKRLNQIRDTHYDVTVNEFHSHSWRLALLVAFSGARLRVGHVTSPGWSHRFSRYSFVFNVPVRMKEDQHETRRYLDLVATLDGRRAPEADIRPSFHLNPEDRRFAEHFLASKLDGPASRIIGVQSGTSPTMRWKQWPVDRYRTLIKAVLASYPDFRVLLFGSPSEAQMNDDLANGLGPRVTVAAGQTSVRQVAALIERCDLLVCNDSGLMHAAVAVGTPVVAIYGPTDIRRTAPLGAGHIVVRRELPCSPCFKLEGDESIHTCPHHDCLMTITPDEVLAAVDAAVSRPAGKGNERDLNAPAPHG